MPCWVMPAVAAEYWRVSVEQVMADVAAGRVDTWNEHGLLFVDVIPDDHATEPPYPDRQTGRRSLAWTVPGAQTAVVTPAEREALLTLDETSSADARLVEVATEAESVQDMPDDLPESIHDEGEPVPLDDGPTEACEPVPSVEAPPQWESIRARVSRLRKPPPRA